MKECVIKYANITDQERRKNVEKLDTPFQGL